MTQQYEANLMDHIHMLGCQALAEARNLGYAEGKGTKGDDRDLLDMIDKHEKLLKKAVLKNFIPRGKLEAALEEEEDLLAAKYGGPVNYEIEYRNQLKKELREKLL